jgi:hypothetical protein
MVRLMSLADLQKYNQELANKKPEDDPVVRKLQVAKRIVWIVLLAAAFLFFYLIDKLAEALAILKW